MLPGVALLVCQRRGNASPAPGATCSYSSHKAELSTPRMNHALNLNVLPCPDLYMYGINHKTIQNEKYMLYRAC